MELLLDLESRRVSALDEDKKLGELEILETTYEAANNTYGPDAQITVGVQYRMANAMYKLHKNDQALQNFTEVYEKRAQYFGQNHSDTLNARKMMAVVLFKQDKHDEALNIFEEVYARRKSLELEDMNTLNILNYIAIILARQGKDVLPMLRDIYERQKRIVPEHPDILITTNHLASILLEQCKYEEALEMHTEILEIQNRLRSYLCDILHTLIKIVKILKRQDKFLKALDYYREIYKLGTYGFGPNHEFTLMAGHDLGCLLITQSKHDEAMKILMLTFSRRERILGIANPDTLSTLGKIGKLRAKQGQYGAALLILDGIYAIELTCPDHPDTLNTRKEIAIVLCKQGEYETALDICKEISERQKQLGPDNQHYLSTRYFMAEILDYQKKYKDSSKILNEVVDVETKVRGLEHPLTLEVQNKLAFVYFRADRYQAAQQIFKSMLKVVQEKPENYAPGYAETIQTRMTTTAAYNSQRMFLKVSAVYDKK